MFSNPKALRRRSIGFRIDYFVSKSWTFFLHGENEAISAKPDFSVLLWIWESLEMDCVDLVERFPTSFYSSNREGLASKQPSTSPSKSEDNRFLRSHPTFLQHRQRQVPLRIYSGCGKFNQIDQEYNLIWQRAKLSKYRQNIKLHQITFFDLNFPITKYRLYRRRF